MSSREPRLRDQRSRTGCWTCKNRRRKCDGRHPGCQNCETRGVVCGGYDVRLQWGTGIASRGRFTGADKPEVASIPARTPGRQRDRQRQQSQNTALDHSYPIDHHTSVTESTRLDDDSQGESDNLVIDDENFDDSRISAQIASVIDDEYIFQQFLSTGIHVLHSTAVNDADQMLAPRLPLLCTQSKALYYVCLAFQTSLNENYKHRFLEYFDGALSAFRVELDACASYLHDATWAAGLLLCSVGFIYGMPWTIHLQGMYGILKTHDFDDNSGQPNPFRAHLLEVMGVMDLPSFAVGRQTPCIGIWRRFCRGNMFYRYPDRHTVEHVSGLPRSLLDIFSGIGAGSEEQDFWDWPGSKGTFLQHQLWEAYRLAGMLTVRHRFVPLALGPATSPVVSTPCSNIAAGRVFPTSEILVARILSHIQAIIKLSEPQESVSDELVVNAINYPVFVAGLEVDTLKSNEEWKTLITSCFTSPHLVKSHGVENQYLLELLEELWQCSTEAPNVDELARMHGRELGLL